MKFEAVVDLDFITLEALILSSEQEGFKFISRLKNDWLNKTNRFDKANENLYEISLNNVIIGIGGINKNPYNENGNVGRLRHFYLLPNYRRKGIGRKFIQFILKESRMKYDKISLRTDTEVASKFYESLGFKKINSKYSSHEYIYD